MELLNNRYKIESVYEEEANGTVYKVADLWNGNNKALLKLYEKNSYNDKIFEYLCNNFLKLSNIKYKYLLQNDKFDILDVVDNKRTSKNQFYYTKEYTENLTLLDSYEDFTFEEMLDVIRQLCDVIDYFRFRGIVYELLFPRNVYVSRHHDKIQIKLRDMAHVNELKITDEYHENCRSFIAPEYFLSSEKKNRKCDIYSIGMIFKFLFSKLKDKQPDEGVIEYNKRTILDLINRMTKKDPANRENNLRLIIEEINNISKTNYHLNFKNEREQLNFSTELISRDKELDEILRIDKEFQNRIYEKKVLSIRGEEGIGKTRLLEEVSFRLKMKGRPVYYSTINHGSSTQLGALKKILRKMIKNCESDLIEKYGCELVKIIPELSALNNITSSSPLSGERESLRLYDRISNFIVDFIKNKPTYIILDDFHNSDVETLKLINYFIRNTLNCPLLFIIAFNDTLMVESNEFCELIDSWTNHPEVKGLDLLKFNLYETTLMIKNILDISYKPINFGTRIMDETGGNPRHIEEIIKNLYATKELFIDEMGNWELKADVYSNINIPPNINEVIKRQIDLLEEKMYDVAKIISLFRTSVSKNILSIILKVEKGELDILISKLLGMKIIDEKVEDWGYTYDFYNIQIKKYMYHSMLEKDRVSLHSLAAEVLEEVQKDENRRNIDELIYHLTLSNQIDKAINYTINFAKKMEGFVGRVQAISLWEKSVELLTDRLDVRKLEVLVNLGRLYSFQGYNEKALDILNQSLEDAKILNEKKYIIISKNAIADICLLGNALGDVEKHIEKAKSLAQEIGYTEGYLEAARISNRLRFRKNEYHKISRTTSEYIEIAKNEKFYRYVAHFYNHIGILSMFSGDVDKARELFENSINYFHEAGDSIESTKAINNIGVVYFDYYDDLDKAMEYLEKGLSISRKSNSSENEIVFLINIAEIYIYKNQYEKGKEYICIAESIAKEINDENDLFLINIHLGRVYLNLGEYEKCFSQYRIVEENFKRNPEQGQNIGEYYDFLSELFFSIGMWDEAIVYSKLSKEKGNKTKLTLLAEGRLAVLKFYKDGILDKNVINRLRHKMEKSSLNSIRRILLLEFTKASTMSGNLDLAREILLEDEKIATIFTTDYLDVKRELFLSLLSENDIDHLIMVDKKSKNKYFVLDMRINRALGIAFYKRKNYYQSIYYLLITLDLLHRAVKKIPDKIIATSFLQMHNVSILLKMIKEIGNVLGFEDYCNGISEEIFLKDHFDLGDFRNLFDRSEFYNSVFKHYQETALDHVNSLDELVMHFTESYESNLELVLEFAMKETFASRGYICVYNDEMDRLKILKSSTENTDVTFINQVVSRVKQKVEGLLIQNTAKLQKEYVYFQDDTKSLICVPIHRRKLKESSFDNDRRKKLGKFNSNEIIGYIYLDSDRLFNRFDKERYELVEALSYLAFLNVDNYSLRKTSSIDTLTGVYTRKYFDIVSEEMLNKNKNEDLNLSVVMVDIDKFKTVNDTFGHRKGDEVLSRVGEIILNNVRNTDIVGRYGGEEFIMMLPNTNKVESKSISDKIREKIESAQLLGGEYPLTVSLGISVYPKHGQSKDELIEKADQALYRAKETGRNKSITWSSDIGRVNKRLDRSVGIVSGNPVQDQRNVLAMVEIIDLIKENINKKEKIYKFLGRLIEIVEGKQGTLFMLNEEEQIEYVLTREIFKEEWLKDVRYNREVIGRVISKREGEYLIDWEDVENINVLTGTPNWQSLIVTPLICEGKLKGVLQISVPIKEREFDYNSYNFVRTIGDIIAAII